MMSECVCSDRTLPPLSYHQPFEYCRPLHQKRRRCSDTALCVNSFVVCCRKKKVALIPHPSFGIQSGWRYGVVNQSTVSRYCSSCGHIWKTWIFAVHHNWWWGIHDQSGVFGYCSWCECICLFLKDFIIVGCISIPFYPIGPLPLTECNKIWRSRCAMTRGT